MHRDIAMHCKHVQVHTIFSTFSGPCNIKALCVYVQLPNNKPLLYYLQRTYWNTHLKIVVLYKTC